MRLTLVRDYQGTDCTQGKLSLLDATWHTMERPWVPIIKAPCGRKGVSCVPPGLYRLVRHNSEGHPRVWALVNADLWVYHWDEDVPAERRGIARTVVLIHVANFASELRGCIAPGTGRAIVEGGRRMVTHSADALADLKARLSWDDEHEIEIR